MEIIRLNHKSNYYIGLTKHCTYVWKNKKQPVKLNIVLNKVVFVMRSSNQMPEYYIYGIADNAVYFWKNIINDNPNQFIDINCSNIIILNDFEFNSYFYTTTGVYYADININPLELKK